MSDSSFDDDDDDVHSSLLTFRRHFSEANYRVCAQASARGEFVSSDDISIFGYLRAKRKCLLVLDAFDKFLDPYSMWHMRKKVPTFVYLELAGRIPPRVMNIFEEGCAAFIEFSDWHAERGEFPQNWKESRQEVEDAWPLRAALIDFLRERLITNCRYYYLVNDINDWYRMKALSRWKRVRENFICNSVLKYWIHAANMPGSAGFRSGMQFVSSWS